MSRPLVALLCVLALGACSKPEKPETERPPSPQAVANADKPDADTWEDASMREKPATELREYMQKPIDRAKSVEATTLDAAEKQRAEIDAQTGGGEAPPPDDQ